jgi:FkbM family methyltransferase
MAGVPIKERIRDLLRARNIEIGGYRHTVTARRLGLLRYLDVQRVIDIGANEGQYAIALRRSGFAGLIESYEPTRVAYATLAELATTDPNWRTHQKALGDEEGTLTLTVTADSLFSSALAINESQFGTDPSFHAARTETVPVSTLDASVGPDRYTAVKMDVQGFERQVIAGGEKTLRTVPYLEMEMSMVEVYEGQMMIRESLDRAEELGFTLALVEHVMPDDITGAARQLNGIFYRAER